MSVVLRQEHEAAHPPTPPAPPAPPPPPVHHADRTLPRLRKWVLFAAPVAVTALGWGAAAAVFVHGLMNRSRTDPAAAAGEPNGAALFNRHCASCHGERGDGRGTTLLTTPARYFGFHPFKFATTTNRGVPSDDDLTRVIRRGIPGSAMPAFPQFTDAEAAAIVDHVRVLTRNGVYDRLYQKAQKAVEAGEEDAVNVGEVRRKVDALVKVGPPLDIPKQFAPLTRESALRGRQVFIREGCVKCHGPEGRGDGEQVKDPNFKNDDGTPARPRDLTQGIYKGGGEREQLYARVMLGIPGTPMPAASSGLRQPDIDDLLNYVLSLGPPPGPGPTGGPAVGPR